MSTNLYVEMGLGHKFTVDYLDIACSALDNSVARMACDEIDEYEQCYVLSWLDYGTGYVSSAQVIADKFAKCIEEETACTQKLKFVRHIECVNATSMKKSSIITFRPTSCY